MKAPTISSASVTGEQGGETATSLKSDLPGVDHPFWKGADQTMQDVFRDYAGGKPIAEIAKERGKTELQASNIVNRMKARFARMGVSDPTPPITGQSASHGAANPDEQERKRLKEHRTLLMDTIKWARMEGDQEFLDSIRRAIAGTTLESLLDEDDESRADSTEVDPNPKDHEQTNKP